MSVHEPSDGIAEEVERHMQLALGAAALAAQRVTESRRQALADAQAHSEATAGQLRSQLTRERALASARVQVVHDESWWQEADPQAIAAMAQTIETWRDPSLGDTSAFDAAHSRLQQEASERWGLDLNDVVALAAADDASALRQDADPYMSGVAGDGEFREPQVSGQDTPGRRGQLRDRLTAAAVPEDAAEARVLADTAQALPVSEALSREPGVDQEQARSHARSVSRSRQRSR